MAISTGAAILGGSLIGGATSLLGSSSAARAAQRGADAATAESQRQFDLIRQDTAPLRSIQGSALDTLASLYGFAAPSAAAGMDRAQQPVLVGDTELPAGTTTRHIGNNWYEVYFGGRRIGTLRPGGPNGRFINDTGTDINALFAQSAQQAQQARPTGQGSLDAFFQSPDFQFNLAQGQQAIDRSLAARGRALSGAGVKEGQRFASGLASQEFGNFTNRLLAMAGLGTTGVTTSANAGLATAGQIGAAQQNAANLRGSAYLTGAQGLNSAVQGGLSNLLLMQYLQRSPGGV